jgi:RNA polymerase sigma factor (sigma-70 family)
LLTAVLCLAAVAAAAQDAGPLRKSVGAVRIEVPPVLDGELDDPAWQEAAVVEDLHVVVSNEFGRPGERSRIYVAFDDDNLYFAARFFDSRPDTIVAKVLSKRDVSFGEDGFSVTLDPYDQGRTGYIFDVNPNGMRSEAIYIDKDRQNWDWEGIWDAAAQIDGEGWTAEVAIPLKTLSFDPARDAWGVNFTRWHGVDSEQYGWMSFNRSQDLSRTGLVTGLAGLQQGHGLDVVPGLRTGATRNHDTDEEDDFLEPSLDVFWKIMPSLTAAVTLNPDFSGTTADTRQINLTRFDLFFPEQRAFFLQDSDIFQFAGLEGQSGIPFFSRRIGLDDSGRFLADHGARPDRRVRQREIQEWVDRAMSAIPEKYREVIILRDVQQLSYEEIEQVLGIPGGTVRSRINRARAALQEQLGTLVEGGIDEL